MVESLLMSDPPLIREAWIRAIEWYKDAVDRPPTPSRVAISTMTAEWVKIYWHLLPPGKLIPVGVQPFPMDDSTPEEKYIVWAVRRLLQNRSDGLSVMIA